MNLTIVYSITEYLARAVTVAYKKAKKDVAKSNRKNIAGFSDKLPSYLSIEFNDTDKKLLRNFEQECFTVACVGSYELEEKLKQAAVEILNKPESDTGNRFEALFEASTKIYRDNKKFLDSFFNYNNRNKIIESMLKKDPALKRDDVTFLMSQTADYINSITRGKAGYGHDPEYWEERNNHFKEWFVHSCEMLHGINFIQKSKLSNFEPVLNKFEKLIADINDKKK